MVEEEKYRAAGRMMAYYFGHFRQAVDIEKQSDYSVPGFLQASGSIPTARETQLFAPQAGAELHERI